jgi:transposase-like protein
MSMSKRWRYSAWYTRELVELVRRSQSNCRQAAPEVGLNPDMLTRRVHEAVTAGGAARHVCTRTLLTGARPSVSTAWLGWSQARKVLNLTGWFYD